MTVQAIVLFASAQLPNAAAAFCTLPATPANVVASGVRVRLANTDSAAHAVTLYAVPNGGSASASNECLPAVSIAANGYLDVDMPPLGASGTYQGFADTASKVTVSLLAGVLIS